jgi:hypothetical protein
VPWFRPNLPRDDPRNPRGSSASAGTGWVVQDQRGLCGGLFVNRAEAVKFAMFENGNRPQAVIMVPGILELDLSAPPSQDMPFASTDPTLRRAA